MGDIHLDKLLRVISFSFLLMPFLSVARGYFQGFNNMMPTAVSQVIEQTIRVSIIVFLSLFLIAHGFDLYTVGAGAMLGSIAVDLLGLLYLYCICVKIFVLYSSKVQRELRVKGR